MLLRKKIILSVVVIVTLVSSNAFTWKAARRYHHHDPINRPEKRYADLRKEHLSAALRTEVSDDVIHYIFTLTPRTDDERQRLSKLWASKYREYLHFEVQLLDKSGFASCKFLIERTELVSTAGGVEVNATVPYCDISDYDKASNWDVVSNYSAVSDLALSKLQTQN